MLTVQLPSRPPPTLTLTGVPWSRLPTMHRIPTMYNHASPSDHVQPCHARPCHAHIPCHAQPCTNTYACNVRPSNSHWGLAEDVNSSIEAFIEDNCAEFEGVGADDEQKLEWTALHEK